MTSPLFSIVIPTYNRSDLVQGAVRSVLGQTFDDFEVVVSDNCSEDDTRAVIEGFRDPRVRYVRTPSHGVIADSWEFARSQARGTLVMMLSDDDAMVPNALARFAEEYRRHNADFLFCNLAEYRDRSFPGPEQNTVTCEPFSGGARLVSTEEFVGPLFAFRPKFNMHPSAFMFSSAVAEQVVQRSGRFFRTNGVEYFAWPLAAVFSKSIVYIDLPLVILGRTAKSWGSTIVLSNPGKEKIQKMIADVAHARDWIPLTNFTLCNLMAEGMLLGKRMFPDELQPFPFNEEQYLRSTMKELRRRVAMGVDVSREMTELRAFAEKYPALAAEFRTPPSPGLLSRNSAIRRLMRTLGLNLIYQRLFTYLEVRKINRGQAAAGFAVSGGDFGFDDALGCAHFVARVTHRGTTERFREPALITDYSS
ncbi:MAG: glycosyltransferase family 2 protein [Acidobacteriota bacterium]